MRKSIILILFLALIVSGCGKSQEENSTFSLDDAIGPEEAKAKAEKYLNDTYGRAGSPPLTIGEVEDKGTVYRLNVKVPNGVFESYISKDGQYFFVEGDNMEGNKAEKPKVELFVMSHCPYGTQIEKGMLPVLDTLGDKIDFDLKFCGYAMHGEKELDEQLTQYCIQEEEPEKLMTYLECFLDKGVSTGCLAKANVDTGKIDKCVEETDKEYKVKEKFADKSTWKSGRFPAFDVDGESVEKYGVSGSPTLVINGKKVKAGKRSPQGLLDTVCNNFTETPEECNEELSTATPSPGFGYGEASSDAAGSCN